jgi:hypothetical protein
MSKYDPLHEHLSGLTAESVDMTFAEVESVLGFALPPSAREYREWWANAETKQHPHSQAWTLAGRKATPNLTAETVRFEKTSS